MTWEVANDSPVWLKPRRTIYFLTRCINGKREYLDDRLGRLRTWQTRAAADKVRKRLCLEEEH
jgi:hypothetical protein